MEAITDPRGNAWQDSTGGAGENGDKCNRNMGVANSSSTTVNNFLGAGGADLFRIQREWSNAAALGPAADGCAASYTTTGSHVEAPSPTGGDVTYVGHRGDDPRQQRDALHYHVSFRDPSDQDDAFSVSDAASLPAGVSGPARQPRRSRAAPDRGRQPHRVRDRRPAARRDGADVDVHDELRRLDRDCAADDHADGDAPRSSTPHRRSWCPGAQSQDYHDALSFGVSATDPDVGRLDRARRDRAAGRA